MFTTPVTVQSLILVAHRYNCLVHDHEQPSVSSYHLDMLAQLFLRYNVEAIFGLHLIHSHFKIPYNTVMLGSAFSGDSSGYWTKPLLWKDIGLKNVHGHIYIISKEHDLLAYEYREGIAPKNADGINSAFFHEFVEYLISNELAGVLGLEVLEDEMSSQNQSLEFVLADQGTVMLKQDYVTNAYISRITGWSFTRSADGTVSVKGHETHASKPGGPHQIFTDGKLLNNIDAVMSLLLQHNIIKVEGNCSRGSYG